MSDNHAHLNEVVQNADAAPEGEQLDSSIEYEDQGYVADEYGEPQESSNQDQFASKFAALSRKEKALRDKELDYDSKFEEMQKKLEDYESKNKEPEVDWQTLLRKDPLRALEDIGLGYDKLTELALNDGKLTPEMQLKSMREDIEGDYKKKFEELETRLNEKEEKEQEDYYNQVQDNFLGEIGDFINQSDETYELIQASNSNELVYDVIEEHYNETGRVLDIKEAADAVEGYLEEEANKLMKLKKLSSRLNINPRELEDFESQVTLSNNHAAQVVHEDAQRVLSNDESKARAARMLQWD
tara:strand:+ start:2213 stop:3109 length:897 start_codon:yes stop_codon:yes gene_type:complete